METKQLTFKDKELIKIIQNGGVVSFPTETVFGIGVICNNEASFESLVKAKNRRPDKPFSLMASSKDEIKKYAVVDKRIERLIDKFMPGEITLILKAKEGLPNWITLGQETIGIRISASKEVCEMIKQVGTPMLVTSANMSGEASAQDSNEATKIFDGRIDAIVSGSSVSHIASTIVKCVDNKLELIRLGKISFEDIKEVWEDNKMKIAVACDHGGVELKEKIKSYLEKEGHHVDDYGTYTTDSCDYPDFIYPAAKAVQQKVDDMGVLVCTTGEGVCMTANKVKGIRCALIYNEETARLCREHNNANMCAFGAKYMDHNQVLKEVDIFLNTEFLGGRHQRRIDKMMKIEEEK